MIRITNHIIQKAIILQFVLNSQLLFIHLVSDCTSYRATGLPTLFIHNIDTIRLHEYWYNLYWYDFVLIQIVLWSWSNNTVCNWTANYCWSILLLFILLIAVLCYRIGIASVFILIWFVLNSGLSCFCSSSDCATGDCLLSWWRLCAHSPACSRELATIERRERGRYSKNTSSELNFSENSSPGITWMCDLRIN